MNDRERNQIFSAWMTSHSGLVFKVVRTFTQSPHDRDDLFQQISLQIWQSIPKYSGQSAVTTWMYRVAFYAAMGWKRKEHNQQHPEHLGDADRVLVQTSKPRDERLDALYDKIADLNDVDRSLALMLMDGFSYRDMSEVLGLTTNHVGVRIHRIKKQLTQAFSEQDVR